MKLLIPSTIIMYFLAPTLVCAGLEPSASAFHRSQDFELRS